MRAFAAAFVAVGLGGVFAAGCSSSTPTGTSGTGTTGAATNGGTTGHGTGGTTGATTGGTGNLAAGSACTGNGQCLSGICGPHGTGNCCSAACATSDATCGATACDGTGACTYPANTVACGTASCTASMLTASACSGNGTCTAGTPAACPNHLTCANATSCRTSCSAVTDCATGFYCNGGTCAAVLADGTACTANAACLSNVCGVTGTGNCCHMACSTTDLTCGATACSNTGACTYPANTTACGTPSCAGHMLTTSDCSGSGTCTANTPAACPNHLTCANATMCRTTCTMTTDCASGFWCSGTSCVPVLADGTACTVNASCSSGVCGVNGSGNCCHAACVTSDGGCGATACDGMGACTYPLAATHCGTDSCSGSTFTTAACNGAGLCVSDGGVGCANNLTCLNATSCYGNCLFTGNSACAGGNFCDQAAPFTCCPGIVGGTSLAINNGSGNDTGCCGYGTAGPCLTLTRGMQLVSGTNSWDAGTIVTLNAFINDGGGNWTGETYPVSLSWGVTLSAPGIYFNDIGGNAELFDVILGAGESAGNQVTLGIANVALNDQVVIGSDNLGTVTTDPIVINIEANQTLNVLNAQVYEKASGIGINVQNTASLFLDQKNANSGNADLYLGGALPNGTAVTSAGYGIECLGTVNDTSVLLPSAFRSVNSQGQYVGIDAEDGCTLSLTNFPFFGTASAGGFSGGLGANGGCTTYPPPDSFGVWANGNGANVTLLGAQFSCFQSSAIYVSWSSNTGAAPVVVLGTDNFGDVPLIENSSRSGVFANAGRVTIQSGKITHNVKGVDVETDFNNNNPNSVILNDGSGTNRNTTVVCSSNQETGGTGNPGVDVYNSSTATVWADFVNWDQWYDPNSDTTVSNSTDIFWCDTSFTCQCVVFDSSLATACINTAGSDDMDVVLVGATDSTPNGSWSATDGGSAGSGCN
jgi:hypothetical protein